MSSYRKVLSLILSLLLLTLTACDSGTGNDAYTDTFNEMNPTPVPSEINSEPTELTGELTLTSTAPSDYSFLKFYGDLFTEKHPGVTINYNMPENRESVNAFKDQMIIEIYSDAAGDVIDMQEIDYQKFSRSGMFKDLYYYMNEDDSFNPDDYYSNIWKATEIDGKLNTMPTGFCYDLLYLNLSATEAIGYTPKLGDSLDYKKLQSLYSKAVDGGYILPDANIVTGIFPTYLDYIEIPNRFVSIDNMTANFTSDEFSTYYAETRENGIFETRYPMTVTGNIDETSFGVLATSQFSIAETMSITLDNVMSLNKTIPIKLDSSTGKHIFRRGSSLAISSFTTYEKLPWEFIKFVIEEKELVSAIDIDNEAWDLTVQFAINKNNCRKILEISAGQEQAEFIHNLNMQLDTQVMDFSLDSFRDDIAGMSPSEVGKFMQEKADIYFGEW